MGSTKPKGIGEWLLAAWFRAWWVVVPLVILPLQALSDPRNAIKEVVLLAGVLAGVKLWVRAESERPRELKTDWHVRWGWGIALFVGCLILLLQAIGPLSSSQGN
jgi:hypothetical protein